MVNRVLAASIASFAAVAVAQGLAIRSLARRTLEVERHQRADGETMRTVSETVRETNETLGRIQRILAVSRQVTQPRITGTNYIATSQAALDAAEKAMRESRRLLGGDDGGAEC